MKNLILSSLLLLMTLQLSAQGAGSVTGTVLDGSMGNEPLMGATVKVVGEQMGTTTDMDGHFSIEMPAGKVLLQLSMMGFKTQVVNVKGKSIVEVVLQEDNKVLDEVVVVGYGSMKKRDLTGAMSQIKSEDLMKGGATDLAHGMQGKIAGVQVSSSDNAPGSGVSITVRGANSFSTSSQPLYIVDGVPYNENPNATPASVADNNPQETNPLNFINPNDIDKIEVLKDASATAIYGSRGANGVIIITTKKGQTGKPKIELNASYGIQTLAKRIKVLDALTYMQYQNESKRNSNYYEGTDKRLVADHGTWENGEYEPGVLDFTPGTVVSDGNGHTWRAADHSADWQDEIYRTGSQQDYNLSISGGDDKGWYSFSGNYTQQNGVIKESGFTRYGLSINIGRHITDWLEVGTSSHVSSNVTDFQRTNSSDYGIIRSSLIFPVNYGATEETTNDASLTWLAANPAAYIRGSKDRVKALNWFSSNYVEAKIQPWLKFRQNIGLGYNDGHRTSFYDSFTAEGRKPTPNGKYGKAANIWKSLTLESLLTFDKTWGIHAVNAVAGATFEKGSWDNSSTVVTNLPLFMTYQSNMGYALDKAQLSSDEGKQTLESFLARVNYTLLGKYLFTASVRSDGSSKFVTDNKFATFYSGAFAWRASDETFIQNLNVFSNLKFRLSFGQTGNQGIGSYRTLTILEPAQYSFKNLSQGAAQVDWRGEANPNLKWETTNQFNAGIDFGFLDNRLQFTVDYYYKKTFDLLQNISRPYSFGYGQMLINSGNVTNEGLEFTLSYDVLRHKDWKWNLNANLSFNRNKIGGLDGDQFATSLWSKYDEMFIQRNGCPIGALYGYVEDGYFDNIAEVMAMKQYSSHSEAEALKMVGEVKYRDINGDGYINKEDRVIIGDVNPKFVYGFTSSLSYKSWNLSFMLQGSQGNDILNLNTTSMTLSDVGNITLEAYENRWREDNKENARYPRATAGNQRNMEISNRYVENGSYLKMKYITLSYEWNRPFKFMEKLRLAFTANNVFTVTNYSWMDPDVNAFGSDASRRGVDSYSYPSARSFTLSLGATF
ncbi:MAG: TonB-dependent receptor [Bacteroidaceae bacterium]|nr:TonB-dependent receptor [Bacteroidaceae bacterium]MBR1801509.1 TonB-dependent receptor [Bacteroidaceae bacterium]